MSFLGKLFGQSTPENTRAKADALFAKGELGPAKLAYERALRAASGNAEDRAALTLRIHACCDELAKQHLEQADVWLEQDSIDLAVAELKAAIDTAHDSAWVRKAEEKLLRIERDAERIVAEDDGAPPSDSDRIEILAASWDDAQLAEYEAHGEPLRAALLQLHEGKLKEARAYLEALVAATPSAHFLQFELGRACLSDGDLPAGTAALTAFLSKLDDGVGDEARMIARIELAHAARASEDFDGAVAHYEALLSELPHDPRAYLALGAFFRREKLPDEAIEVLDAGLAVQRSSQPEWRMWQELGLAQADAGRTDAAMSWLSKTIDYLSSNRQRDLPPEATRCLAKLYEANGNAGRALDLYAVLAQGSDRDNLARYHFEAGRLMRGLGLDHDARRMLQKARALAPDDAALCERVERALADDAAPVEALPA